MIGRLVSHFKILEKLGDGGMGSVYRGIDTMLDRPVAIKVLRAYVAGQPALVDRFRSEAALLAKLNHPRIATLYSFFREGDEFFMVMELIDGVSIAERCRQAQSCQPEQVAALVMQVLEGLQLAHERGIVHRDIKPANLLVTSDGHVKITDFGIGRALDSQRLTRDARLVGTIEYLAPERIRGEPGDAPSDIYSVGVVLYELLTNRIPFERNSDFELMRAHLEEQIVPIRHLSAHLPEQLERIVARALEKKPENRFHNAAEMRSALAEIDWTTQTTSFSPADPKVTRMVDAPFPPTRLVDAPLAAPPVSSTGSFLLTRLWLGVVCGAILLLAVVFLVVRQSASSRPGSSAIVGDGKQLPAPRETTPELPSAVPAPSPTLPGAPAAAPSDVPPLASDPVQSGDEAAAAAKRQEAARARRRAAALKALDQ